MTERGTGETLEGAEQVENPEPPHHPRGFPHDPPGHLRLPEKPVHEENGDLAETESLSPCLVVDLDLESVSVRLDPAQIDRLEHLAPEALEAPGQILQGHAGDDPAVDVRRVGEDQPVEGPVDDRDAVQVPRAHDQIGDLELA